VYPHMGPVPPPPHRSIIRQRPDSGILYSMRLKNKLFIDCTIHKRKRNLGRTRVKSLTCQEKNESVSLEVLHEGWMEHALGHGVVFSSKSMYFRTVICLNDYAKLGMLRRRGTLQTIFHICITKQDFAKSHF
jgi:hypothetical protein